MMFNERHNFILNVYEHRNGLALRATDLTLIMGGYVLHGSFNSTDSYTANVVLRDGASSST